MIDHVPVQWFLNDRHDTRSNYYLEDAATEFQVQGCLELDWVCVTWDADLRRHAESWRYHSFRGDACTTVHKDNRKRYLLNAQRVLSTRPRQGMVIFVPPDESDPVRALREMKRGCKPGGLVAARDGDYGAFRWYMAVTSQLRKSSLTASQISES